TQGGGIAFNADKDFWYLSGCGYPKQWENSADGIGSIYLGSGTLQSNGGDIILKAGGDINSDGALIDSAGGNIEAIAGFDFAYGPHEDTYEMKKVIVGYEKKCFFCFCKYVPIYDWVEEKVADGAEGNDNPSSGGDINLYNSDVLAQGGNILMRATNITAINSLIETISNPHPSVSIRLLADNQIELGSSMVHAKTDHQCGLTSAFIELYTKYGDILLHGSGSDVIAEVEHSGFAKVELNAGDDISINHSRVKALVGDWGHAEVELDARGICWRNGDITVESNSEILAKVGEGENSALVDFDADDDIEIYNSTVKAVNDSLGRAKVKFVAGDNIKLVSSLVKALANNAWLGCLFGDPTALVDFYTSHGDISLSGSGSDVIAEVENSGSAKAKFNAAGDIYINDSRVKAKVGDWGHAEVEFDARGICRNDGDIILDDSEILAKVGGGDKTALVDLNAEDDIRLFNSDVKALNETCGLAKVLLRAHDEVELGRSLVRAQTNFGESFVEIHTDRGDITLWGSGSDVIAESVYGYKAKVKFNAGDDIELYDSSVKAKAGGMFSHAEVEFDARGGCHKDGDIILDDSEVLAKVGGGDKTAVIDFDADDDIRLFNSTVKALNETWGPATILLRADDEIELGSSIVQAKANQFCGLTAAFVELYTKYGDILLYGSGSDVIAEVVNSGFAKVHLNAGDDISINHSRVKALVGNWGHAEVELDARGICWHKGDITVENDSQVLAKVGSGENSAIVDLDADDDIKIENSTVEAINNTCGLAKVLLNAGDNIVIDQDSVVSAYTSGGLAGVLALAGGEINAAGLVQAISNYGVAGVALLALRDIYAGNVQASGNSIDVIAVIEALLGYCVGTGIDIGAQYPYASGILLGSLLGDITLGNISADMVLAAALGLDGEGSIYDEGDVYAHYLGLLARNDIGTALTPINTDVDILSAFSYDEGNIYINEANDIELGLYLPVSMWVPMPTVIEPTGFALRVLNGGDYEWRQVLALGASVAANDGIIHITSAGNMVVNSVVSPRGGVFLESTEGSIYAGKGWCPANLSGQQQNGLFLMDVSDTQWGTIGEISDFAALMAGVPDLPPGPNVIAGGYSYFSTPNGTIGIGSQDLSLSELTLDNFYNPVHVCIQVIENSHSALPEGVPADAGLTMNIGGTTAPDFAINTGDGNGPLGVSGAIMGIVRPGVTAVTGVYPSPALYPTDPDIATLYPPGYVFYEDTDSTCCSPLYGPEAANIGNALQIWPEPLFDIDPKYLANTIAKYFRAYYELLDGFRVVFVEPAKPTEFFSYHPLTPTDSSAFDEIALDVGAYDFIAGNIKLKKALAPYFGQ
ncbi:hypothetical protein ACFL1D_05685, partial [Candidatus Omnitrophota bacterium]